MEIDEEKGLDTDDVDTLKSVYGKDVSSYLSESDITPKKTNLGAFMISKTEQFQECQRLFKAHLVETSREKQKPKIARSETPEEPPGKCYNLPDHFQLEVDDDEPVDYLERLVGTPNRELPKCETPSIATEKIDDILLEESFKHHIEWLTITKAVHRDAPTKWDYDKMFLSMTGSSMHFVDTTKYERCLEGIKPILMKFHRQHEKFKYVATLKRVLESKKPKGKGTSPIVTLHDFQRFFSQIFARVIPTAFFGNNRNEKKARRVLKEYYQAPFGDTISLKSFLERINISCITWLQPIEDEATRRSVFAEFSKWMFGYYFSVVLNSVFLVHKATDSTRKQILFHEMWSTDRRKYIRDIEKNKVIVTSVPDSIIPKGKDLGHVTLIRKQTGIRPIYVSPINKCSAEGKQLQLLKTLLQQLYYERHEFTKVIDLRSVLESHINEDEEDNLYRWRLVACDIQDAFGSIVQEKLFDIVNAMINGIRDDTLVTRSYAVLTRPRFGTEPRLCYTQGFTCFSDAPVFRRGSLITPVVGQRFLPETIEKETARTCIKNFIFNQPFQMREKVYFLKQGIFQGSPLSPILADIYYGTMREQAFRSFIQSDTLFRYVDDFLFISKEINAAKKFLEFISGPIPEYNCCFNKTKIQSNVRSLFCKETKSINYLGYRINGATLEMRPDFEKMSSRYSVKVPPTIWNPIQWFSQRLNEIKFLKLNGIALNASVNKVDAIATIARLAAHKVASRGAILIPAVFKEIRSGMKIKIMKEIASTVAMLTRILKRHLDEKTKYAVARIRVSIWGAFFEVFAKDVNLRSRFCKDIKHKLELSKRW